MTALLSDPQLDQTGSDDRPRAVELGPNSSAGQGEGDSHGHAAAFETLLPGDQTASDAQQGSVAGDLLPRPAELHPAPEVQMPVVEPLLFVHATAHNDLEAQRIASENRLRILTTLEPDDDGVMRGFGLDESHPDVARLRGITDALAQLEKDAEKGLRASLRRSSIYPWVKAQVGLGDKQVARLLAAIGDPYWHLADDRARTVSELWAYSGLHVLPARHTATDTQGPRAGGGQASDPGQPRGDDQSRTAGVAARRRKGVKANWSTDAKTRAYLCAVSCIKQADSPYRAAYLARRARTAETHPDWTPGHSHNDGLRIASKAILRDLWREARRLHGVGDPTENH